MCGLALLHLYVPITSTLVYSCCNCINPISSGPALSCMQYTNCSSCATNFQCGWCESSKQCGAGSASGSSNGTCSDWHFAICNLLSLCTTVFFPIPHVFNLSYRPIGQLYGIKELQRMYEPLCMWVVRELAQMCSRKCFW